jgi:glycerophosphoryl diester phosphodiesterase
MDIYAHRGASGELPENTMAAFERAIALGVAGIETDLHATADDEIILTHDPDLSRTFGIERDVRMMTWAEVHKAAPEVPRLVDLLELAGDRIHLDLEIKQSYLEPLFLPLLARFPRARWAISCFDWRCLARVRELNEEADLWLLSIGDRPLLFETAKHLQGSTVAIYDNAVTTVTMERAAAIGVDVMAWTVNDPERRSELAALGVSAVCTDHPHIALSA